MAPRDGGGDDDDDDDEMITSFIKFNETNQN